MFRTSLSSAVLAALVTTVGCAQNQPANTTTAPAPTQSTADQPASPGMMVGQGMVGSGGGRMGPGMTDAGAGMMGGQGMMGEGHAMMGPATGDGSAGMMGGQGMMGGGHGMIDMMGMGDQCPLLLQGTTVQAKDTTDGMAMTFATTGDVAELRRRVRVMADHMNAHSSGSSGGMGMHGMMMGAESGSAMMGGGAMMRAQVEDVDKGARLKMTPVDAAKLNDMRQHMKPHVQMMNQSHSCSMATDAGH